MVSGEARSAVSARRRRRSDSKVLNLEQLQRQGGVAAERPVLVILAAGKGTRFGQSPKCAQPVCGIPLARHSMNAFRSLHRSPVIGLVGYRHEEVVDALGDDNIYVLSENPAGGTAFAAFEAFSVPGLGTQSAADRHDGRPHRHGIRLPPVAAKRTCVDRGRPI